MTQKAGHTAGRLDVVFRSLRSGRLHEAAFDLGSNDENRAAAIRHAWCHSSEIVSAALTALEAEQ